MTDTLQLKSAKLDWVKTEDETVILDDSTEEYFATNPAGSLLWNALKAGSTREELAQLLVDSFEIGMDRAIEDVDVYVGQLAELDMLEDVPEPGE